MFKFAQVSNSWMGDLALQTEDDIRMSRKLVQLWTNFAKNGKPTEGNAYYILKIQINDLAVFVNST